MEEAIRYLITRLFNLLAIWTDFQVRNISGKYIIIRNLETGLEYRVDVVPYIDMTEVSE